MNKRLLATLLALLSFIFAFIFFGFFYDYYEAYASALVTGKITPSIRFDDWFYFGYLGFVKVFAFIYSISPSLDWYSAISYTLLITALTFYIKSLDIKITSLKLAILITTLVFFMEHYMLLNMNRVSFLLSFIAMFYLFGGLEKFDKRRMLIAYLLFTLAFLFRLEAAMVSLIIAMFTSIILGFTVLNVAQLKRFSLLAVYPIVLIVSTSIWFSVDIKNSEDFYKQIEPDVEYELMTRNNIISISNMDTPIDSMRYEAIYNGVWGDAVTNDLTFIRSLIGTDFDRLISIKVIKRGLNVLSQTALDLGISPYVNCLIFLLIAVMSFFKSKKLFFRFSLYQLVFVCLLVAISGYVKMTAPALSAMLFINLFTLLFYGEHLFKNHGKHFFALLIMAISIFKLIEMKKVALENAATIVNTEKQFEHIQTVAKNKKLYLSGESLTAVFHGFQPFRSYESHVIKDVFVFNALAMSTIRPYKDYLDLECNCNSNDYASYFTSIKNEGDQAVFLMSAETKDFYEDYLKIVHELDIEFLALDHNGIIADNEYSAGFDKQKLIKFYTIVQ